MKKINYFQIIFVYGLLLYASATEAQIKKTASVGTTSNTALFNVLNAPSKKDNVNQAIGNIASGATAINTSGSTIIPESMFGKNKIGILYGVPTRVALDRYLLNREIDKRISELLELITYWESTSESMKKKVINDYMFNRISKEERDRILALPTIPDHIVQDINKTFREQISQLSEISNSLYNECSPVEFKSYKTDVTANVRFYSPIPGTGALGFMRANGSGQVNLSKIFSNISYNDIYKSPVSGSLLIYTK